MFREIRQYRTSVLSQAARIDGFASCLAPPRCAVKRRLVRHFRPEEAGLAIAGTGRETAIPESIVSREISSAFWGAGFLWSCSAMCGPWCPAAAGALLW